MPLLSTLAWTLKWTLKCIFTCNHAQTTPKEGKCYCPECGRGVIFQWVVMRCLGCRQRIGSHTRLRQLTPDQCCCPSCGHQAFECQYLDAPSYFQLEKARLMLREEDDYLQGRYHWSVYAFGEHLDHWAVRKAEQAWHAAKALLTERPAYATALISVQSSHAKS